MLSFDDVKAQVKPSLLLVTATDGNHGFGVAYLAKLFGCKAKVMMMIIMIMMVKMMMMMMMVYAIATNSVHLVYHRLPLCPTNTS